MITAKAPERPPITRYVLRNNHGLYYVGHGHGPARDSQGAEYEQFGQEPGVPYFGTTDILNAIKYGDLESIEVLIKNHKKWCIDQNRDDLFGLLDPANCEVVGTHT